MFNIHLSKVFCQLFLTGYFYFLSLFLCSAQQGKIVLSSAEIIKIESHYVSAGQFEQFNLTVDTVNGLCYSHIGSNLETNELYFLCYDLEKKTSKIIEIPLSEKIDFRYGLFRIGINYPKKRLFFIMNDQLVEIAPNDLSIEMKKLDEAGYIFAEHDVYYCGNYGRYSGRYDFAQVKKIVSGKTTGELNFSKEDVALTSFANEKLILKTRDYLFWCHVSKPIIYRYNNDLKLIDSLVFDQGWVTPDLFSMKEEYKKLYKQDVYSFYMKAIEDTLHVNRAIQLLNDSTIFINTINQMDSVNNYFIHFNHSNLFLKRKDGHSILKNCNEMDDCYFLGQESIGTMSENKLYYVKLGKAEFPWEKDTQAADYSKYTYIHLYIFVVK